LFHSFQILSIHCNLHSSYIKSPLDCLSVFSSYGSFVEFIVRLLMPEYRHWRMPSLPVGLTTATVSLLEQRRHQWTSYST